MASLGVELEKRREAMWLYPRILDFKPTERWGHSACLFERIVYFFGGCRGGLHFSDVLTLKLETMVWGSLATTSHQPGARDSHTATLVGHRMVVFGGTNGSKKLNDLYILDLKSKEWMKPNCKGMPPSPRESHTATVVGEDKVVIFGGSGEGEANYLNDINILDVSSMTWTCPVVNGKPPVARDSHTAVAICNRLLVYGGDCGDRYIGEVDVLDMETMTWLRWEVKESSPGARAGHAAVTIGTKIYFIGGVGDEQYFSDVWMLDIFERSWTQLGISGQKPRARFSHTAVTTGAEVVIYGGCGEDERPLDELLVLHLGFRQHCGLQNISMCKIFGNHLMLDNVKSLRGTTKMSKSIDYEYQKLNQREEEIDLQTRSCICEDNSHLKRKKIGFAKVWEMESEQEEHSLSLSQHSSPSRSEQEQNTVRKPNRSSLPKQQCNHLKVQHSRNLSHTVQRTSEDVSDVDGESSRMPKTKQLLGFVPPAKQEVQFFSTDQILLSSPVSPTLLGADVRGTVDGAFDSGYLMTAEVNGRILRGVLFSPGPGVEVSRSQVHPESSPVGSPSIAHHQSSIAMLVTPLQPPNLVPECGQYLQQAQPFHAAKRQVPRPTSDFHGVDLTLGGPREGDAQYGGR